MKNKAIYLVIIPSTIALLVALSEGNVISLVYAIIIGLALGVGECVYLNKSRFHLNKLQLVLAAAIGLLICYAGCKVFYQTWIPSQYKMRIIVTKIFSDYPSGLRIICIFLAIVSWPAATTLSGVALYYVVRCVKSINYRGIWTELIKGFSWTSLLKKIGKTIGYILLAVLIGTALLIGVYDLPTNQIANNVEKSSYIIQEEGTYPHLVEWATSQLDNWTDSIMLMESANEAITDPINDAMNIPRGYISGYNPAETIVAHYIKGMPYERITEYPRYWHGYLVFLKLLLEVMDYETIRLLNGIAQILLVVLLSLLLVKKGHKLASVSYIAAYLMLMPIALAKSIQFSTCFYVFSIGCLALLLIKDEEREKKSQVVFLYCGILTAFFDFLTYPISTFGVPMLVYLLLSDSETTESKLSAIIKNGLSWCIGFAGMWASKWVLASIITGENIIANGIGAVANRTSNFSPDGTSKYSIYACEIKNFKTFFKTPATLIVIMLLAFLIVKCIRMKKRSFEDNVRILFPFFLTGLAPIVWYAFATNHSMIHYWFTNKACVISILAILFGVSCLLQVSNPSEDQNRDSQKSL